MVVVTTTRVLLRGVTHESGTDLDVDEEQAKRLVDKGLAVDPASSPARDPEPEVSSPIAAAGEPDPEPPPEPAAPADPPPPRRRRRAEERTED